MPVDRNFAALGMWVVVALMIGSRWIHSRHERYWQQKGKSDPELERLAGRYQAFQLAMVPLYGICVFLMV